MGKTNTYQNVQWELYNNNLHILINLRHTLFYMYISMLDAL